VEMKVGDEADLVIKYVGVCVEVKMMLLMTRGQCACV
jgi:hypothetical protein